MMIDMRGMHRTDSHDKSRAAACTGKRQFFEEHVTILHLSNMQKQEHYENMFGFRVKNF